MDEATTIDRLLASFSGLCISLVISSLAYWKGYFRALPPKQNSRISFFDVFAAILMFFVVKLIIGPATFVVLYTFYTGVAMTKELLLADPTYQGILNAITIVQLAICYFLYLLIFRPKLGPIAFGKSVQPWRDIRIGILSWVIAYPWVFTVTQGMEGLVNYLSPGPSIEQDAVQFFRELMIDPPILVMTLFLIAIIVPIVEEIIFRGLLQQWLKELMPPVSAIFLTAFAFSLAHFSSMQSYSNLPIITGLFTLSLFLGYLRERQGTLLAPIALHATVNTITLIIIILQEQSYAN